jgi:hypothetical protein
METKHFHWITLATAALAALAAASSLALQAQRPSDATLAGLPGALPAITTAASTAPKT